MKIQPLKLSNIMKILALHSAPMAFATGRVQVLLSLDPEGVFDCVHTPTSLSVLVPFKGGIEVHGIYQSWDDYLNVRKILPESVAWFAEKPPVELKILETLERWVKPRVIGGELIPSQSLVTQEEVLALFDQHLPYLHRLDPVTLNIKFPEFVPYVMRDKRGEIKFLNLRRLRRDEYYGVFFFSSLTPSETMKHFYLSHQGPFASMSSHISNLNVVSQEIHKVMGYVKGESEKFLV